MQGDSEELCNSAPGSQIQATFQTIKSPENLIEVQKTQAGQRMDSIKKYDAALNNFQKQLEGIQSRQERIGSDLISMYSSVTKSSKKMTEDIETFKKEVASMAENMGEALASLDKGLEDNNKKFEKDVHAALDNLVIIHNAQGKRDAVEVTGVISEMAKVIYNYI